jgi:hypothetical protein
MRAPMRCIMAAVFPTIRASALVPANAPYRATPASILSDASRAQPDDDGGENHHRLVVDRPLLIARGDPTLLLEQSAAALHHVAPRLDRLVEEEGSSWLNCALPSLGKSLGNRVRDPPLPQQSATARAPVAFVGDEAVGPGPWLPPPAGARSTNAVQNGLELRAVMALPWRDDDGERTPMAVTGEVEFGGQSAPAASESFIGRMGDPFFSSARLRRRRAPLAC